MVIYIQGMADHLYTEEGEGQIGRLWVGDDCGHKIARVYACALSHAEKET